METTDFGNITVPTKWEDVNLKQYQEIQKAREENSDIIRIISILTDKKDDEIRSMPASFISTIVQNLNFLGTPPKVEPSNKVDDFYIKTPDRLTFGEWLDANNALQNDKYDYATVLAILCRRTDEEYNEHFIETMLDKRRDFFKNMPLTEILAPVLFFSKYWTIYTLLSNVSSSQMSTKEELTARK